MKYEHTVVGMSGIYIISNEIDSRIYVGSARSFRRRYITHKRNIINGTHGNPKLIAFANKYGIDKLTFKTVHSCEHDELLKFEQEYLDKLQPFDSNGFNILRIAGAPTGYKHTDETKEKFKTRPKRKVSEEEKEKLRNERKGVPRSAELKDRLSSMNNEQKQPLLAYNKEGFIAEFDCARDAAIHFNIKKSQIKSCYRGNCKTTSGLTFIKKSDIHKYDIEIELQKRFNNERLRSVVCKDLKTGTEIEYISVSELARAINTTPSSVVTSINREYPLLARYYISYK